MSNILYLLTPKHFSFEQTLFSHGWSQLAPFAVNREQMTLSYVFAGEKAGKFVAANIADDGGKLKIEIHANKTSAKMSDKILRDVRHILRFDDDLQEFYNLTKKDRRLKWIGQKNAGRLLRSPTVFEDLVKTVCTTNCSWALTKKMVANLVEKLGDGGRAFPTAMQMASVGAEFYRNEIRAGYRSVYFAELAENAASGKVYPETWLDSPKTTAEIKKEMKSIKGVGDYAAENLLKLVGRYDGLALDSWLRAAFYKKHNGGEVCGDKEIKNFYEPFGDWRGLAIWCDMADK